jgi:hypothetical protein
MDRLDQIPVTGDIPSTREKQIMDTYFSSDDVIPPTNNRLNWTSALKIVGYAVFIFMAIANPFSSRYLSLIPYVGENPINLFITRLFIMFLVLMALVKFTV